VGFSVPVNSGDGGVGCGEGSIACGFAVALGSKGLGVGVLPTGMGSGIAGLVSRPVESGVSDALGGDAGRSPAVAVTAAFAPDFTSFGNKALGAGVSFRLARASGVSICSPAGGCAIFPLGGGEWAPSLLFLS
jgi:hypothetical protein